MENLTDRALKNMIEFTMSHRLISDTHPLSPFHITPTAASRHARVPDDTSPVVSRHVRWGPPSSPSGGV